MIRGWPLLAIVVLLGCGQKPAPHSIAPPKETGVFSDEDAAMALADCTNYIGRDTNLPGSPITSIIFNNKATDDDLKYLVGRELLVSVYHHGDGFTDESLQYLARLESLRHLQLGGRIDRGLKYLADLEDLEKLSLSSSTLTSAGLKELVALTGLIDLGLEGSRVTDADLAALAGLKLKILRVPKAAQTDLGLKHLLACLDPAKQTSLNLTGWQVTDNGLQALMPFPWVEALDLSQTQVQGPGLKWLRALRDLKSLSLEKCLLNKEGFAALWQLSGLTSLNLKEVPVSAAEVKRLLILMRGLKRLTVGPIFTPRPPEPEEIADMQKQHPNCKILWQ